MKKLVIKVAMLVTSLTVVTIMPFDLDAKSKSSSRSKAKSSWYSGSSSSKKSSSYYNSKKTVTKKKAQSTRYSSPSKPTLVYKTKPVKKKTGVSTTSKLLAGTAVVGTAVIIYNTMDDWDDGVIEGDNHSGYRYFKGTKLYLPLKHALGKEDQWVSDVYEFDDNQEQWDYLDIYKTTTSVELEHGKIVRFNGDCEHSREAWGEHIVDCGWDGKFEVNREFGGYKVVSVE